MPKGQHRYVGGLVAVGFDPSEGFLPDITHSGRSVFSTRTWERLARNFELADPEGGVGMGIGLIEGLAIPVTEMNYANGEPQVVGVAGGFEEGSG